MNGKAFTIINPRSFYIVNKIIQIAGRYYILVKCSIFFSTSEYCNR